MGPTALTAAQVTAFIERQRALDERERETQSHYSRGEKPVREVKRTKITRGEDYLNRSDDDGNISVSGRVAGRSWYRTPNGTNIFTTFAVRAPKREELDEALGETASPHTIVIRRLWKSGDVEIDHFDLDTADEVREDDYSDGWYTSTLSDYVATGASRYPHKITTDFGNRKTVETVDDVKLRTVDPAELAIPPNKSVFALGPGLMQTIPMRVNNGEITVRVDFGTTTLDYIVDSGSTNSYIDVDAAVRLHLERHANLFTAPSLRIGGYGARNVRFVGGHLDHRVANGTEVGVLGSDFFSAFVVGIDYKNGELSLIDPASFDGSKSEGFVLPLKLKDGVPFAKFKIGDHESDRFLLDTGSNIVVVTARFARKYADDVRDHGGTFDHGEHDYYSSYGSGYLSTYPAVVNHMQLGPVQFNTAQVQVEREQGPPAPGFRTFDGVVGYNLLRFFDVWFDYSRNEAWLAPNGDRSTQRSGRAL